jgi:hypothetical protein
VVSVSNPASRSSEPQKYSGFTVVAALDERKWLPCGYPELNRGPLSRVHDERFAMAD